MTRMQILLTEEQDRRLEKLARRLHVSKAKLVREGIDYVLDQQDKGLSEPLLDLVGQAGPAGRTDISIKHDAYLRDTKLSEAQ